MEQCGSCRWRIFESLSDQESWWAVSCFSIMDGLLKDPIGTLFAFKHGPSTSRADGATRTARFRKESCFFVCVFGLRWILRSCVKVSMTMLHCQAKNRWYETWNVSGCGACLSLVYIDLFISSSVGHEMADMSSWFTQGVLQNSLKRQRT